MSKGKTAMCRFPSSRVFSSLAGVCLALVAGAAAIAAEQADAPDKSIPTSAGKDGGVAFVVLAGDQTGLRGIIEKWAAEELERQGGKYGSHGWWLWGLSAVDIDNDGDPDLIPSHHGTSGGLILRNTFEETGTVTFVNATGDFGVESRNLPQGVGRRTFGMDLNGDGWLDLVGVRSPHYVNEDGKKLAPYGTKGFHTIHTESVEDVNNDGYPDIVERLDAHILDPETVSFKHVPHVPACEANVPAAVMEIIAAKKKDVRFWRYGYLTGHDLNGDGTNDVVVSGFAGYSGHPVGRYLIATEGGKFSDRTMALGLPGDAVPIKLADLNGDGAVDVLAAYGDRAGVYLGNGRANFALSEGPPTTFLRRKGPYLHRAWTVDFDCDGDPDLVLSNPRYGAEEIYENTGEGRFELLHKARGWDSDPIVVCDVNVDGLPDVAIGGPGNSITIYLNASPSPGHFCNIYVRGDSPNVFAAGAKVEVFRAGKLGVVGARPRLSVKAPSGGEPVHVGFGEADTFDLRVTFPGEDPKMVEIKAVRARPQITVTPDGKLAMSAP
jgi:hypothetical protein